VIPEQRERETMKYTTKLVYPAWARGPDSREALKHTMQKCAEAEAKRDRLREEMELIELSATSIMRLSEHQPAFEYMRAAFEYVRDIARNALVETEDRMEFRVKRTSNHGGKKLPCLEAYKKDGKWVVKIDSLDELITFVRTHGEIVVDETPDGLFAIEIYDDWRE